VAAHARPARSSPGRARRSASTARVPWVSWFEQPSWRDAGALRLPRRVTELARRPQTPTSSAGPRGYYDRQRVPRPRRDHDAAWRPRAETDPELLGDWPEGRLSFRSPSQSRSRRAAPWPSRWTPPRSPLQWRAPAPWRPSARRSTRA
jgi:hypothetical protein